MAVDTKSTTLRRSVSIPQDLLEELFAVVTAAERENFNRLILTAVREFVATRRARTLTASIAEMVADPDIQRECKAIEREFAAVEADGFA